MGFENPPRPSPGSQEERRTRLEGIYEEVWCVCRRRDGNRRREGESNKESTSVSLIVRTGKQQTGPASQRRTRSEDEKHSFCDDDGETLFQRRGTSNETNKRRGGDLDRDEVGRGDIFPPSPLTLPLHRAWHLNPPTPTVLSQGQSPTSPVTCAFWPVPSTRHSPKNPWTRRVDNPNSSSPSLVPARLRPILKRQAKR